MLILLRQISIPELRKHLLRYGLTLVGILLGVAIFSAVRTANTSLQTALRHTVDQIAGKAVLQVTVGQAGVPEAAVDDVRSVPGVRAAAPIIEAVVRTTDASQGNILILGVDLTGDRSMRDYTLEGDDDVVSDPLVFLAQPDSIILAQEFASRNNLKEDDQVTLVTALGNKVFTVRGIMIPKGIAKAFGGNIGVMDIYAAQFVFSRDRFFDRVDVALHDGVTIAEVLPRLESRLGPGYKIDPPARRGKQTESLMTSFSQSLFFSSIMALLIGLFLVFNAFSVSVTQRRTQIGILRALGVTRAQVQGLFLSESLVLGLVGSVAGVVVGTFLGRAMMLFMAAVVEKVYGVRIVADKLHLDPQWTALAIVLGLATAFVGAYLPTRAAARVDPVLALQKGKFQLIFLGENWYRSWVGVLLVVLCWGMGYTLWSQTLRLQLLILATLFIGITLLVPAFSHMLAALLRHPMGWIFGVEGRLASDSLMQAPRRTSATVAALMFSLAFVINSASSSASVQTSLMRWVDAVVNPDLVVSASEGLAARTFQFPAEMGQELQQIPGVRQVDAVRVMNIEYQNTMPLLVSIEIDQYLRRATPLMEEGRVDDLPRGMIGRHGVLISSNFARRHQMRQGDHITLGTPTGQHTFEVVGVEVAYASDSGTLVLDRRVYQQLWNDNRVDNFDVMLAPGYKAETVKQDIQRHFAAHRNVFVFTNQDVRGEILRLVQQFSALTYVQLVVAVLVAVVGIFNSMMVSISERKREIGILRALGGERHRVRKAILLEAVCVGVVALVLGTVAGTILGFHMLSTFGASITGWIFPYTFPTGMVLALVPGVVGITLLAAWYPASLALKTSIAEALAYE